MWQKSTVAEWNLKLKSSDIRHPFHKKYSRRLLGKVFIKLCYKMFFWWLSTKLWLQHGLQCIHRMCNLEKLAVSCATQAHSLRQRRRGWKRDSSARYRSENTLHPQLKCFYWPDDGTSRALQKKIASSCCYLMATNSLGALSPPTVLDIK